MSFSHVLRRVFLLGALACTSAAVTACGTNGGPSGFSQGDASAGDSSVGTFNDNPDGGNGSKTCKPMSCGDQGFTCGMNSDGCGNPIDCGTCTMPEYCGGGGYSKCGGGPVPGPDGGIVSACTPYSCATAPMGPYNCGSTGDGCNDVIDCGTCPATQFCGGGGFNQCGGSTGLDLEGGVPCTPATTCPAGQNCGQAADGCGALINCGSCSGAQFCGGGGVPSVCGGDDTIGPDGGKICTPLTSCPAGQNCGQAADGCGGLITCGTCTNPAYCGGGGPSVCGGNNGQSPDGSLLCTPTSCAALGNPCGQQSDGCGGVLTCTQCVSPQTCGGGGVANQCGGNNGVAADGGAYCVPKTCASFSSGTCGQQADGCGGVTASCGGCSAPDTCGGGGVASQCGNSHIAADGGIPCTPVTTCPAGQNCGQAADGCGALINCGTCSSPQYCGGGGTSVCGGNDGIGLDGSVICTPHASCPTGQNCGQAADGCGGLVNCGTCTSPQYCGGGGPSICGGNDGQNPDGSLLCTPTTCAALGNPCGQQSDGCGGVLTCTQCVSPQTCGGGGVRNQCGGNNGVAADGGAICTPKTCASFSSGTCGQQADGCGGVTASCGGCSAPDTCGGGGVASQCGNSHLAADGGNPCTPATTCPAGITCGQAANGCGGLITCGTCTLPNICGGGGVAGKCGNTGLGTDGGALCTPTTCGAHGYNCGAIGDGCGGQLSCGSCTDPQYCGGGGYDLCGGSNGLAADGSVPCKPTTCATLGYNCGITDDGCGGTLSCGSCTSPQYCGGGGYDICGPSNLSACSDGGITSLTGYVYDPGDNLPIYNALVYVPVDATKVTTPTTGINTTSPTCGCSAPAAFASAYTAVDGSFTLNNVPSGSTTVVVNLGKWQRVFTENVVACQSNTATNGDAGSHLTLPSTHLQGNIPRFAVDTGNVDSMECVLSKMGISTSEFTDPVIVGGVPTAAGRIHFYQGSIYAGGAVIDGNTPTESALTETATVMDSYDVILFPCQGGAGSYTGNTWPNTLSNLRTYANDGGRVFATHFHYDLIEGNGTGNGSFGATATWNASPQSFGDYYADPTYNTDVNTGFTTGAELATWLNQGSVYGGTYGVIPVGVIRTNVSTVVSPAQTWLDTPTCLAQGASCTTPAQCCSGSCSGFFGKTCQSGGLPSDVPIHYTFDTPFNQTPSCGRVVYSDFHVESEPDNTGFKGNIFPAECQGGATGVLTPQEKLLEFMLFDLTSCVSPPSCTPLTCANFAGKCGVQGDGCGGQTANCGTCTAPQTCGGGGVASECGYPDSGSCASKTCTQLGVGCGPTGDGCGNVISCGSCTAPATCGGGGTPGQCGYPDAGCTPLTCANYPSTTCGEQSDGCGGHTTSCNPCTAPATCGGGGVVNQCGYPDAGCTPSTCSSLGLQCGYGADGCGGVTAACGTCPAGSSCKNNVCVGLDAGGSCVPETCSQIGIQCGQTDNGCGTLTTCPTCPSGQQCLFNQCVSPDGGACAPLTCSNFPSTTCGEQSNGCGGHTANCNPCTAPATCGGGGVPNQCGYPESGACTPLACSTFPSTTCGPQANGCGGVTANCNPCTPPATCGGGGTAGQCGYPDAGCIPGTCSSLALQCGYGSDGCGGVTVDCGTCPAGSSCENNMCVALDAGGACVPETCSQLGIQCGQTDNGCGTLVTCPTCPSGQRCLYNQCVAPDGGACTPLACSNFSSTTCGEQSDGCGGHTANCNPCTPPAICGGGGVPNQCGYPEGGACTPLACASFPSSTCGPQADGCGGVTAFCNPCTSPATCGGGGVAGRCGYPDAGSCVPQTCQPQNIGCAGSGGRRLRQRHRVRQLHRAADLRWRRYAEPVRRPRRGVVCAAHLHAAQHISYARPGGRRLRQPGAVRQLPRRRDLRRRRHAGPVRRRRRSVNSRLRCSRAVNPGLGGPGLSIAAACSPRGLPLWHGGKSRRRTAGGTEEVMQTALITGASRGIGRRVAERLADDGMRVLLAVRRVEDAPRLPNGEALPLDVASPSSIAALVEQLSERGERIDVLVNNAGVYEAPRREIWNVNVRGPWLLTRGLAPLLADGARVVMVTSGLAQGAPAPLRKRLAAIDVEGDGFGKLADDAPGGYGASKAALNRMAELFAKELAPRGIKVNAISPGWARTAMGGPGAPRSIDQGADSVLWGARLGANGPSGGFFEDGHPLRA